MSTQIIGGGPNGGDMPANLKIMDGPQLAQITQLKYDQRVSDVSGVHQLCVDLFRPGPLKEVLLSVEDHLADLERIPNFNFYTGEEASPVELLSTLQNNVRESRLPKNDLNILRVLCRVYRVGATWYVDNGTREGVSVTNLLKETRNQTGRLPDVFILPSLDVLPDSKEPDVVANIKKLVQNLPTMTIVSTSVDTSGVGNFELRKLITNRQDVVQAAVALARTFELSSEDIERISVVQGRVAKVAF